MCELDLQKKNFIFYFIYTNKEKFIIKLFIPKLFTVLTLVFSLKKKRVAQTKQ